MRSPTPMDTSASGTRPSAPVSSTPDGKRRRFLRSLGAGGAGVAAVAIATSPLGAVLPAPIAPEKRQSGYQETKHVRDYYRTAKV